MSKGRTAEKRGLRPGAEGLVYLVKLSIEDYFLTGVVDGDVIYRREDSEDGHFVTLKTFAKEAAQEWMHRLEALGCSVKLQTMDAPKYDYVVRARDESSGKYSIHVVANIPGWGAEHRVASLLVKVRTGLCVTGSMRLEGVRAQAEIYIGGPYNQGLDPAKHMRHEFRDWEELMTGETLKY